MPWCGPCGRFYNPNTCRPDGTCPEGHQVAVPPDRHTGQIADSGDAPDLTPGEGGEAPRVPWHFWVMVVALAIYLGWRLIQGVIWLIGRL